MYKIFNENEEKISFSFQEGENLIFYFNKNGQFYRAKELVKINHSNESSNLYYDYWYTALECIENGYLENRNGNGKIPRDIIQLTWIDDFGNIQTKETISLSSLDFHEIMDLKPNYDYTFDKLIFEKGLIVKRIWKYNNTNLEYIVKKHDETNAVFELIIENVNLRDKN